LTDNRVPELGNRRGGEQPADLLVGRDRELQRLNAFLDAARTDGAALLITGEPGVGKTELLNAASDRASLTGTRVLRAAGIQFEAEMAFAGLNQVLLPLLDNFAQLGSVHRDALNIALGFGEGAPPSRLVVSNATTMLLRLAAVSRPLLVVIDDLPWLDRASAGVLSFVSRRLEGTNVGMLGASRTGEADFFEHAGLPELDVPRLDEGTAQELLDSRFPDLASAVRDRILIEAQGNPLALMELPTSLSSRMRASAEALPVALPLGRRLQALYRARIAELPAGTRWLLLLMALDGTGDVRVLKAAAADAAEGEDLAPAEDTRLAYLDEATHRLAFRHPLIRSAIVEFAESQKRREAHRVLADVWEDQPERRAWHLAEASIEPDESVAALLEAVAGSILARGDAVGCVKALTRSADLTPGDVEKRRRLAAAAYIGAEVTGDLRNASQVLAELRRGRVDLEGSLYAAIAASSFLVWADGDLATAHRLLFAAIEGRGDILDAGDPVVAEALFSLMVTCSLGEERLWPPFDRAFAKARNIPVILDLSTRLYGDPARADAAALASLDRVIAGLPDESDPQHIIRVAMSSAYVGRMPRCRAALSRVADDARRGGAVASGIYAMQQLAHDAFDAGRWEEADQLVDEAILACKQHGYDNLIQPAWYFQALLAAVRGDAARAETLCDGLVEWARPRGLHVFLSRATEVRAVVALARGDFEGAYQFATTISPPGVLAAHSPEALRVLSYVVESAVHTGRRAEAEAHVAAMKEADLATISPTLKLIVDGCAAMIARDDTADAMFKIAITSPAGEELPFQLARVQLLFGERLRRRRAMSAAQVQLSAAIEIFERLGARPWVERATAELRGTGQRKPRAGESVLDRLTPQEFEIVTLAASGLTNKQIAERLYLSDRTVGGHLHRAFPKLGVSTRASLRDALGSIPPEQRPLS
jgi:DNA-binding CsgD family transcriptional regulator